MIDLDREMRALLDDEVGGTPAPPDPAPVLRRVRRRQVVVATGAFVATVALVIGSIAGVSALVRSSDRVVIGPDDPAPPAACPSGSTPDLPGPAGQARPPDDAYGLAQTVFDPGSGRVVLLSATGAMWTFDVCTNTWSEAPRSLVLDGVRELVADDGRSVAFQARGEGWRTWVLEPGSATWAQRSRPPLRSKTGLIQGPEAVVDPERDRVLVWEGSASALWSYDVDADAWTELAMDGTLPPPLDPNRGWDAELMTYDAAVDRLILYVGGESGHQTWEFDLVTARWSERQVDTPATGFGWVASGDETVFAQDAGVTVLSSGGTTATYDASLGRWAVLSGGDGMGRVQDARTSRLYFAMTYDPRNDRVVVAGGDVWSNDRWRSSDDVIALDVATGRWIELVPPSLGAPR